MFIYRGIISAAPSFWKGFTYRGPALPGKPNSSELCRGVRGCGEVEAQRKKRWWANTTGSPQNTYSCKELKKGIVQETLTPYLRGNLTEDNLPHLKRGMRSIDLSDLKAELEKYPRKRQLYPRRHPTFRSGIPQTSHHVSVLENLRSNLAKRARRRESSYNRTSGILPE